MRWISLVAVGLLLLSTTVAGDAACAVPTQRVQCGDLTCNATSHTCEKCVDTSQCYEEAMECNGKGFCVLRNMIFNGGTVGAIFTILATCSIAAVAGVGGGAILVALFVPAFGIPVSNAVAFSQATITGQSLLNVFVLARRYHPEYQPPKATRPVINWVVLAFWLPISLIGTLYGNMAGKVVPDWFRMVALLFLLSFILYRVVRRIIAQRQADKQKLLNNTTTTANAPTIQKAAYETVSHLEPAPVTEPAMPQFPKLPLILAAFAFVPLFVVNIVRNPTFHLMHCGSVYFWILIAAITVYECAITFLYREHLKRLFEGITMGAVDSEKVPFQWNRYTTILFPIMSSLAGGAASLLGIGGGLVLNFLLLEAKLVPEESSATSAMFTLLVAAESALQYVVQGAIPYDYGLLCFGCGIVSTLIGQFVFVRKIKEKGWTFLMIVALAIIMTGSMLGTLALGVYNTVTVVQSHGDLGFGTLCH